MLVTGCCGFIGARIVKEFMSRGFVVYGYDILQTGSGCLTLEEVSDASLETVCPDCIVLCGAEKSLVRCEVSPAALNMNVFMLETYCRYTFRHPLTHVVFISSDMVFGGFEGESLFDERHPVQARNAYGRMKIAGEQIMKLLPFTAIVRTSLVYGELSAGELSHYAEELEKGDLSNQTLIFYWAAEQLRRNAGLRVPRNVYSTPTFVEDLVRDVWHIVDERRSGIFHSCGPVRYSRANMLRRVFPGADIIEFDEVNDSIRPLDVSLSGLLTRLWLGGANHIPEDVMPAILRRRMMR